VLLPRYSPAGRAQAELLKFALTYPGAWEDHPWGETVAKVKAKVFVFFGVSNEGLSLSVKLPHSGTFALGLDWAQPTGYGLGKAGWVTARFPPRAKPPLDVLRRWIDESYRAVAPRDLLKELQQPPAAMQRPAVKKAARRRSRPRG
jgi:predicted DNA-binding protein (MmcQ/YjbR family)